MNYNNAKEQFEKYLNSYDRDNGKVRLMVGREMKDVYPEVNLTKGKELLRVEHLDDGKFLKDISFELHQGEILGFYGLVGSGRTEIMRSRTDKCTGT